MYLESLLAFSPKRLREPQAIGVSATDSPAAEHPSASRVRRGWRWADLMRRVLAAEVLACARCGGRLRRIATLEAFETAWRIRRHLNVPTSLARIAARRSAPRGHTTPLPSLRDHLPFRALLEEIHPRWQQLIAREEQHRPAGA